MKKISLFLLTAFIASSVFISPTFAEEEEDNTVPTSDEITCIQDAITVRDTALTTAYDTFATTVKAALSARTIALKDAWTKSTIDEIRTALKDAWKAYRKSIVDARIALRRAKITSWKEYGTKKTTCFTGNKAGVDSATVQSDAQL